jgi:hypothetical protein
VPADLLLRSTGVGRGHHNLHLHEWYDQWNERNAGERSRPVSGHAAYGCAGCCGYNGTVLDPNPFSGPPDIDNQDSIYANDCTGDQVDVTGAGYNWGSSNTVVATLPDSTLHTVAAGSATGSVSARLEWGHPNGPSCEVIVWNPSQGVTVANPNQVEPIDINSQGPAAAGSCPTNGYAGYVKYVTNQVQYATGFPSLTRLLSARRTL